MVLVFSKRPFQQQKHFSVNEFSSCVCVPGKVDRDAVEEMATYRNRSAYIVTILLFSQLNLGVESHARYQGNEKNCHSRDEEPPKTKKTLTADNGFSIGWSGSMRMKTDSGFKWLELELIGVGCDDQEGNSFELTFSCGHFNIIRWPEEGLVYLRGQMRPSDHQQFPCAPIIRCAGNGNLTVCNVVESMCNENNNPGHLELNQLVIEREHDGPKFVAKD